ncbi:MAG: cation:proton antiporter, partial [Bradymonadaceae bacterium]
MELPIFDATAMLVVLASIFGLLNHHVVKLPFAVGMMVSSMLASVGVVLVDSLAPGLALEAAFQDVLGNVDFTEALLRGMIGFLLFAGSLHTDFDGLWEEKGPILALSTVGLLMSTGILAVASFNLFWILGVEVPFMTCLLFGALISPTDPVAVLG